MQKTIKQVFDRLNKIYDELVQAGRRGVLVKYDQLALAASVNLHPENPELNRQAKAEVDHFLKIISGWSKTTIHPANLAIRGSYSLMACISIEDEDGFRVVHQWQNGSHDCTKCWGEHLMSEKWKSDPSGALNYSREREGIWRELYPWPISFDSVRDPGKRYGQL